MLKGNERMSSFLFFLTLVILLYVLCYYLRRKYSSVIKYNVVYYIIISGLLLVGFVYSIYFKVNLFSEYTGLPVNSAIIQTSIAVAILIAIPVFLIRKFIFRLTILILMNFAMSTVFFSDVLYFRFFNDVTSVVVLNYISQVSELGGSIVELLKLGDVYFFVDILLFVVIYIIAPSSSTSVQSKWRYVLPAILLSISIFPIFRVVSEIRTDTTYTFSQTFANSVIVERLGIMNYHIFDAYKLLQAYVNKPALSEQDKREIQSWFEKHSIYDKDAEYFGAAKGRNLIVIQQESLQEFVVGMKINGQEVTPNLNGLLNESFYFENFYDQTHLGRTSDGELTALTSLYPISEGTINFRYSDAQFDSLPKVLKKLGYSTLSAHAHSSDFYNRRIIHRNYGFEISLFKNNFELDELLGWGLTDKSFYRQSIDRVMELNNPFFAFLISLTTHHPYNFLPDEQKELDLGDQEGTLLGNYLHTVHYADQAIGYLIDQLKEKGLYNTTIIAIYGDHDAGIDEFTIMPLIDQQPQLYKLTDKVPFIVHIPGMDGVVKSIAAGHLDITPTLLHLLGVDTSITQQNFMGNNLFLNNKDRPVTIGKDGSFVTDSYVYQGGSCYQITDGDETNPENCTNKLNELNMLFKISDAIIKTNYQID